MNQDKQNKLHMLKEKFVTVKEWVMDHTKILMPLVLIVCVLFTILFAVNANQKEALQREVEATAAVAEEETAVPENMETPQYELDENAYQDVNNIIRTYYDAQAEGDVETISSLNTYLNDIEKIRVKEMSKYIESYPVLNVYTKPGLSENSYVAYVYSEVKFLDVEQELPGMQTYYIEQDENGNFSINDGTYDDGVWSYIKEVTLQDDVVDLNNKVVVEYNELLAGDKELSEFIAYLKEKINEDVGEILAKEEHPVEEEGENAGEGNGQEEVIAGTTIVRATEVVNIRTSDSENADKIDKAQIGQEFALLEQRENGWSKVEHDGKEVFIKSDYLEVISEEPEQEQVESSGDRDDGQQEEEPVGNVSGTVTVTANVKIRKGPSKDSEALGTAYIGEKLDLIKRQSDGWTQIKYNGKAAYVKSDYVE